MRALLLGGGSESGGSEHGGDDFFLDDASDDQVADRLRDEDDSGNVDKVFTFVPDANSDDERLLKKKIATVCGQIDVIISSHVSYT